MLPAHSSGVFRSSPLMQPLSEPIGAVAIGNDLNGNGKLVLQTNPVS